MDRSRAHLFFLSEPIITYLRERLTIGWGAATAVAVLRGGEGGCKGEEYREEKRDFRCERHAICRKMLSLE